MDTRSRPAPAPLTFDLPEALFTKIASIRTKRSLKSVSEVVRFALAHFDFSSFQPETKAGRQISVRVSSEDRARLRRVARQKRTSLGEVLRQAIEALDRKSGRSPGQKSAA